MHITHILLFQTTKIQTFESNSQHLLLIYLFRGSCFRLQRYKLLKAIHNTPHIEPTRFQLFQTTKIQTFESNSQRSTTFFVVSLSCFRLQRYKLLKAIHNKYFIYEVRCEVVSDYKDTNF